MLQGVASLKTQYDWSLLLLAGVVCLLTSIATITLFRRALATIGRARLLWLMPTAATAGYGIWATHFVAILAVSPGLPVSYDLLTTLASLSAAALVAGSGFTLAARNGPLAASIGGAIVGLGIAAMDYASMRALDLPGHTASAPGLVVVSLLLGVIFGIAAVNVAVRSWGIWSMLSGALLLTLANLAGHFTSMGAVEIVPDPAMSITALTLSPHALSITIAAAAAAVFGLSLVAFLASSSRQHLTEMAIASIPQGICMYDRRQRVVVRNHHYAEMYGLSLEETRPGVTLRSIVEICAAQGVYGQIEGEDFIEAILVKWNQEATNDIIPLSDGRFISVHTRKAGDGGCISTHEDITERHLLNSQIAQQNQLLREQEVQLDAALNNISQGLGMFDGNQRLVICNERFLTMYGLNADQVKPGTTLREIIELRTERGLYPFTNPNDYLANARNELQSFEELTNGRIFAIVRHPMDGGGWVATHEDVTDRDALHKQLRHQYELLKEQQEQLRARNVQFDAALNHMSEALCFFDREQRLIVCNDRYAEMYNLRPDAIRPGMTLHEIIDLRYQAGTLPAMPRAEFDRWWNSVFVAASPSDSIVKQSNGRVFVIRHRPMANGGWVATHDDITEREELHAQLKEQFEIVNQQKLLLATRNLQFDTALNNISQGLCFFDGSQRLIISNNRYIEMYNLEPLSVLPGITLREIVDLRYEAGSSPIMPQGEYRAWRNEVIAMNVPTDTVVELMNGRVIEIHHRPMSDGGWVATHEDITQKRQAEDLNQRTIELLRTTQEELTRAAAAAQASNEAKSSFLANMSHEIRTPLNGVLGMAQSLQNDELSFSQLEKIAIILDSGNTLMTVLNDVLDLSKIEAGKLEISCTAGDIVNAVGRIRRLFLPQAEEKGLGIDFHCPPDFPHWFSFDPVRVRQCVSNLLSNAIKFTETGTITIAMSSEACDKDYLISIAIADSGIGMTPATMSSLFSAFTQADGSTSRRFGGTGLGLTIARQLARMMGGDVTAVSKAGRGSTFTISFRATAATRRENHREILAESTVRQEPDSHKLLHARILLADDNAVNRQVIKLFLAPLGVTIVEAKNGREALGKLAAERFDLVLLDIHMPIMDGRETIKAIRASVESWRAIPVLALTADAMSGDREKYLALGMDDYLSKPVDRNQLHAKLIAMLELQDVAAATG